MKLVPTDKRPCRLSRGGCGACRSAGRVGSSAITSAVRAAGSCARRFRVMTAWSSWKARTRGHHILSATPLHLLPGGPHRQRRHPDDRGRPGCAQRPIPLTSSSSSRGRERWPTSCSRRSSKPSREGTRPRLRQRVRPSRGAARAEATPGRGLVGCRRGARRARGARRGLAVDHGRAASPAHQRRAGRGPPRNGDRSPSNRDATGRRGRGGRSSDSPPFAEEPAPGDRRGPERARPARRRAHRVVPGNFVRDELGRRVDGFGEGCPACGG